MEAYYLVGVLAVLLAYASQRLHAMERTPRPARTRLDRCLRAASSWNVADSLLALLLVSFSGFRYLAGTDFELYSGMYRRLRTDDWAAAIVTAPQEPGFTLFRLTVKTLLGDNPLWLFLLTSVVAVVPMLMAFKHLVPRHLAVAVGTWYGLALYVTTFNGIRQAMATGVLMLAVVCWPRHRAVAVLLVAAAGSLHVSVFLVAAVLWLTYRWRPTMRRLVVVLGVGSVSLAVALPRLAPLLGMVNPRYLRYVETGTGAGLGTVAQLLALVALLGWVRRMWPGTPADPARRWFVWASFAVPCLVLGLAVVEVARLGLYFRQLLALLVPVALSRSRHLRRDTVLLSLALVAYLTAHLLSYDDLLPYMVWVGHAR